MTLIIDGVLERSEPRTGQVPVILDSPHSGTCYPTDFRFSCPPAALREAEDLFVDDLIADAPACGATVLHALFPRSYIDTNRALDDIDPALLDSPWPEPLNPSDKSRYGLGLIRSLCGPGLPIYGGPLTVGDVARRIERYYLPYHLHLGVLIETLAERFGTVWHLNCHSMPSMVRVGNGKSRLPDFVLGDRHGTSCESQFVSFVRRRLQARGYWVTINDPFAGAEILRRFASPWQGRHSLQLEINRALYMDEHRLVPHEGYTRLRRDLTALIGDICTYASGNPAALAAE